MGSEALGKGGGHRPEQECSDCHFWLPVDYLTYIGQCGNGEAREYKAPVFSDKRAGACFRRRVVDKLDFVWCQRCRETVPWQEFPNHVGCEVFVGTAQLPVEEMMELTVAGD